MFTPLQEILVESRNNANQNKEIVSVLETLKQLNSEGIFVDWAGRLKYENMSPFVTTKDLPKLKLIGLGWQINSPLFLDKFRKLGIGDLYKAIATRNDIYLIAREDLVELYKQYMLEHYDKEVKLKSLLTLFDSDESLEEYEKVKVFHNLS